ncbi:MAG: hypothetical protein RIF32_14040 [Leptospirales bacterium]
MQSKLEYWDESYPDHCRTLYRDWQLSRQRGTLDPSAAALALREMVRTEISRNRSLAVYIRECLGATRSPEQRLEDDILTVPYLKLPGNEQFAGV